MGCTEYLAKAFLDWSLQGATPTAPSQLWADLATSSPTSRSAFAGAVAGRNMLSRFTVSMAAANSPQGSATNVSSAIGICTGTATYVGFNLYDAKTSGTRLMWGTLTASITCASGDTPGFTAGGLVIVMS